MDTGSTLGNTTGYGELSGTAYGAPYDPATYWNNGGYNGDDKGGPGPRVMAASTLDGDNVVTPQGDKLGDIKDIMIDVPTGRVAYAVLSVGGFLGIGEKLIAIPWRALQIDPQNHQFILNVTKEQIEKAEGFDKDRWPSMADERWATSLHDYYKTPYYWR